MKSTQFLAMCCIAALLTVAMIACTNTKKVTFILAPSKSPDTMLTITKGPDTMTVTQVDCTLTVTTDVSKSPDTMTVTLGWQVITVIKSN